MYGLHLSIVKVPDPQPYLPDAYADRVRFLQRIIEFIETMGCLTAQDRARLGPCAARLTEEDVNEYSYIALLKRVADLEREMARKNEEWSKLVEKLLADNAALRAENAALKK